MKGKEHIVICTIIGLVFLVVVRPWSVQSSPTISGGPPVVVATPTPTATPSPTPEATPVPRIDVGSKVVIVEKQLVYNSRAALQKGREILASGKPDAQIDRVINRMIKNGECIQLKRFMRATIIDIQGDDVQIRQGDPGPYAAKWWVDQGEAQ